MPIRSRAIIYVRGTSEEIDEQLAILAEVSTRRSYDIVSIVRDSPSGLQGYHDAHRMLRDDDADLIVIASTTVLPDVLESATGSLSGPRIREAIRREGERQRRTRPIRRREGGGV